MLLWLVAALGFLVCVVAWHLWQGITWEESAALFIAAAIVFSVNLKTIYDEATTDHYLLICYVTSLIDQPPYSYSCGRHSTCHEPQRWIIEQSPHPPSRNQDITYRIHQGDGIQKCHGECYAAYEGNINRSNTFTFPIYVEFGKFTRTKLGDSSAGLVKYYNPVQISDDIIYADDAAPNDIPYFKLDDYNRSHRLISAHKNAALEEKLENINASLAKRGNISVGLIVTPDELFFEKIKRAWHQGKANDFVIVVNSPDEKTIRNVNVLGWNNYELKENVAQAIMGLPSADIDAMLSTINDSLQHGPTFAPANFSKYNFLQVKIPSEYYWKIIIFQVVFFIYMLILLSCNPNTKEDSLSWDNVFKMWQKGFSPPKFSWYLHPFTPSGIVLYFVVPWVADLMLFQEG